MRRLILCLLCLTMPAQAETYLAELYTSILDCDRPDCIGEAGALCTSLNEDGNTTPVMVGCLTQEAAVWDELMNDIYGEVRKRASAKDEEDALLFPQEANRAERLLQAQRAWISFRDANCAADYALWGQGSLQRVIAAECYMRMTAERTLDLRIYLDVLP